MLLLVLVTNPLSPFPAATLYLYNLVLLVWMSLSLALEQLALLSMDGLWRTSSVSSLGFASSYPSHLKKPLLLVGLQILIFWPVFARPYSMLSPASIVHLIWVHVLLISKPSDLNSGSLNTTYHWHYYGTLLCLGPQYFHNETWFQPLYHNQPLLC